MPEIDNIFISQNFGESDDSISESQSLNFLQDRHSSARPNERFVKEWRKKHPQRYTGDVFLGNIHRRGFYFFDKENKLFYDGLFYANKLEGYSQVFYGDGSDFQGLFKNNTRYGPGIYTYLNGEQDVGLWAGKSLIRLACFNPQNLIPTLANTPTGELKLLKYRYLVPVFSKYTDIAYTTLKTLGANSRVLEKSHKLYNLEVENKRNLFFNKEVFDDNFYDSRDWYVDVIDDRVSGDCEDVDNEQKLQDLRGDADINKERMRQIRGELKNMESRLENVRLKMNVLLEKVEYCRACCCYPSADKVSVKSKDHVNADKVSIKTTTSTRTGKSGKTWASVRSGPSSGKDEDSSYTGSESMDYDFDYGEPDEPDEPGSVSVEVESQDDVMGQIKGYLTNTCACSETIFTQTLEQMEKELVEMTRDYNFYNCICKNLNEKLRKHMDRANDTNKVKTKKILVTDVLAWNNEYDCMLMMRHSFRHRKSEYMITFKLSDVIAGNRSHFKIPGQHERNCIDFLGACRVGDTANIFKHITKNNVNVNVSDSKGNSGVIFAAVNYQSKSIKLLVNLGANLDQMNDEGLMPLSICILLYLADKYDVTDWEKSFLPNREPSEAQKEAYKWVPSISFLISGSKCEENNESSTSIKDYFKKTISHTTKDAERIPYMFDLSYVIPPKEFSPKRKSVTHKYQKLSCAHRESIKATISALIESGANPNSGGAPLPALFLSLFTEEPDLVDSILEANADVNCTMEYDLTPLHVVASLKCSQENVMICHILLAYDCDPRLKTTRYHWPEQKQYILGKNVDPSDVEDLGKNPLHILCMRRDFHTDHCNFFYQMAMMITQSDIDCGEKYLGHTPLSLAVLMGNLHLVESLLKCRNVCPHQELDNEMGNVLTVYILKRYHDQLPSNAKEIMSRMVELGINPLRSVGKFENAIAFMEKEHENDDIKKRKPSKPQGAKTSRRNIPTNAQNEKTHQEQLMDYLFELGRETIIKYIQLLAVENLYNLIEEDLTHLNCVKMLAEFLTPPLIIPNLQLLFKRDIIKPKRFSRSICTQLFEIVIKYRNEMILKMESERNAKAPKKTKKKVKIEKNRKGSLPKQEPAILHLEDYINLLDVTDFSKKDEANSKPRPSPPSLYNAAKYHVCFHCLKNIDKVLLPCPRCQLIYFCSDTCNQQNLKLSTSHTCNINFYESVSKKIEGSISSFGEQENLGELYERIRESCKNRWLKKLEEERELVRKALEAERKADTYGTRSLKGITGSNMGTLTLASLLGSDYDDKTKIGGPGIDIEKHIDDSIANKTFSGFSEAEQYARRVIPKVDQEEKYRDMLNKRRSKQSTLKWRKISEPKTCTGLNPDCTYEQCKFEMEATKAKCKCLPIVDVRTVIEKIKVKEDDAEKNVNITRIIPSKYHGFIELLSEHFPDTDLSSLLLPYTCYSNGELYRKNLGRDNYYTKI